MKPNISMLTELNASGARSVPEGLRSYLDFLCRKYTEFPPFHLANCLLAGLKIPYCIQMDKPKTESKVKAKEGEAGESMDLEEGEVMDDDDDNQDDEGKDTRKEEAPELAGPPMFRKPGGKAIRWITDQARSLKFVMTRVGKPDTWDKEVSFALFALFPQILRRVL